MRPRPQWRKRSAGYTLMELLVVVALLGVILLVAIPTLSTWAAKMRIDGAVRSTAMHIAAARLKAVSSGFDYRVSLLPEGTTYTGVKSGTTRVFSVKQPCIVIDADEGAGVDSNGNNIPGEWADPTYRCIDPPACTTFAEDLSLVHVLPSGVKAVAAPPNGDVGGYTAPSWPPPSLVFRKNGMADMDLTTAALYVVYLTDDTNYYAVSVWHSGRIKTHRYDPVRSRWMEEG